MTDPARTVALVVEDEPLILMEAVDILEGDGFRVLEAWSADKALELLARQGPVDLLFTDVHMPGSMNGFALAREVRRLYPQTAIVVCSGYMKAGADDLPDGAEFIEKPFSPALVRRVIAKTAIA